VKVKSTKRKLKELSLQSASPDERKAKAAKTKGVED
jgi:hypothetical protein